MSSSNTTVGQLLVFNPMVKSAPKASPPNDRISIDDDVTEIDQNNLVLIIVVPIVAVILIVMMAVLLLTRHKRLKLNKAFKTISANNNQPENGEELQPLKQHSKIGDRSDEIITLENPPEKLQKLTSKNNSNQCLLEVKKCTVVQIEDKRKSSTSSQLSISSSTSLSRDKICSLPTKYVSLPGCVESTTPVVEPQSVVPPERPNSLSVMTVIGDTSKNSNGSSPTSKGFSWSEQLWTPDADIIHESISPCVDNSIEDSDKITPLMARNKFRMKPKGLLERRGSNVALTISLSAEEKEKNEILPTMIKSPKPLVYLRTASCMLDPQQLHEIAVDTHRLQTEFWEIPMNHPSEKHFAIPGYGTKNRYRSILPNPHSRVMLPATPSGDPLSMYINANYIRGYSSIHSSTTERNKSETDKENSLKRRLSAKRKAAFIATQGPMTNTIGDFWKMVWRERSNTIIMITKLKEQKEKCAEYLPHETDHKQTYEDFTLTVTHVRRANHYDVRTVVLRNNELDESRIVKHFWYREWLDHDTPEKTRSVLELLQEVSLICPEDNQQADIGPVVVHCSAGIGRTGCLIGIAIGSKMLQEEGKVDILKIVCQLRMDRGGMIQTWEQYQYVHLALSRFARVLAGENVTTPSTAGSVKSPPTQNIPQATPNHPANGECQEAPAQVKRRNYSNNSAKNFNELNDSISEEVPFESNKINNEKEFSGAYSPGKRSKPNKTIFFSGDDISYNKPPSLLNITVLSKSNNNICDKQQNQVVKLPPVSSSPLRDFTNSESSTKKSPKSAQYNHVFTFPSSKGS